MLNGATRGPFGNENTCAADGTGFDATAFALAAAAAALLPSIARLEASDIAAGEAHAAADALARGTRTPPPMGQICVFTLQARAFSAVRCIVQKRGR